MTTQRKYALQLKIRLADVSLKIETVEGEREQFQIKPLFANGKPII